jgi:hypothetical protein
MAVTLVFFQKDQAFFTGHLGHVLVQDDYIRQVGAGCFSEKIDHFQAILRKGQQGVRIGSVQQVSEDEPVIYIVFYEQNL